MSMAWHSREAGLLAGAVEGAAAVAAGGGRACRQWQASRAAAGGRLLWRGLEERGDGLLLSSCFGGIVGVHLVDLKKAGQSEQRRSSSRERQTCVQPPPQQEARSVRDRPGGALAADGGSSSRQTGPRDAQQTPPGALSAPTFLTPLLSPFPCMSASGTHCCAEAPPAASAPRCVVSSSPCDVRGKGGKPGQAGRRGVSRRAAEQAARPAQAARSLSMHARASKQGPPSGPSRLQQQPLRVHRHADV